MFKEIKEKLLPFYNDYTKNVSTDGMAISLETASFMYYLCNKYKFKTLMDRGSGFSSFVLRLYAKEQKEFPVTVYSVDDSEIWLNKTKDFLEKYELNTDNMFIWEDFYKSFKNGVKFEFILEDAKKYLRVETPDELTSFLRRDGVLLWDDSNAHGALINNQCSKLNMKRYDIKEFTIDKYNRYATLTTTRILKDFEGEEKMKEKPYRPIKYWSDRIFDNSNSRSGWQPFRYKIHENFIRQHIDGCKKILDFGAGQKSYFPLYEEMGIEKVITYDITNVFKDDIIKYGKEFNFKHDHIVKRVLVPKFKDMKVDAVICCNVLQHSRPEHVVKVMKELYRISNKIIGLELYDPSRENKDHIHFFTYDYPKICEENGWNIKYEQIKSIKHLHFVIEK